MTSPTPPRKSLAGQILAVLLDVAKDQASLRAESRVRHEWQTARITALESRMGATGIPTSAPLPHSPESLLRRHWHLLLDVSKHIPWGRVAGAAMFVGGLVWQWLVPLFRHLLTLH